MQELARDEIVTSCWPQDVETLYESSRSVNEFVLGFDFLLHMKSKNIKVMFKLEFGHIVKVISSLGRR